MLDLDDFRDVNNGLGHQAGDELLRGSRAALVAGRPRHATCMFRYGGDEFAFLLPSTDAGRGAAGRRAGPGGRQGARRLGDRIGRRGDLPGRRHRAAEVLLAADRACFVAKRNGRDRIVTAAEGLALATEFSLQAPTPVDSRRRPGGLRRPRGPMDPCERPERDASP